jgi:hypothetical protein
MFSRSIIFIAAISSTALAWSTGLSMRDVVQQAPVVSCYSGVTGCNCPIDVNGDDGVLINVFPVRFSHLLLLIFI